MEWARAREADGYDVFIMGDHLGSAFATSLGLLATALATTSLRVASTVYNNDFRHPALLANEMATLDVLSDGRLEFGIGAGWVKHECDEIGMPFDPPGARVDRMIESVSIIKRLWTGEEVRHEGAHYTINGLGDSIRPLQQPHPPIFIGGGGKRLLTYAAQEADIVGILARARPEGGLHFGEDESEDVVARKVEWVRQAAGERFDQLELALLIWDVQVTDTPRAAAEHIAARRAETRGSASTAEQILASPYHLIGSIDGIVERVLELRERFGISYFTVFPDAARDFAAVVERLKGAR